MRSNIRGIFLIRTNAFSEHLSNVFSLRDHRNKNTYTYAFNAIMRAARVNITLGMVNFNGLMIDRDRLTSNLLSPVFFSLFIFVVKF